MDFDYSKLRGRIKEIYRTQDNFADAFFRGVSYKRLSMDYHYENPYKKVIDLIKSSEMS